jgi:uncharacterized protein YggE
LGKALTIVDNNYNSNPQPLYLNSAAAFKSSDTSVSVGAIDVSYNVEVKFVLR